MLAARDGRCARGDLHWQAPDSARFDEGDPIGWSFIGAGWAHAECLRDEEEPEEFMATPGWKSQAEAS